VNVSSRFPSFQGLF